LVSLACPPEAAAYAVGRDGQLALYREEPIAVPVPGAEAPVMRERPVIVGFGPAGMFAALFLAEHGFRPVILERGDDTEKRREAVGHFYKTGILDPDSNIQFGAGGAGTFSDGKLMTRIADPICGYVLARFVAFGADPDILVKAKPHVGTDVLLTVVANIRNYLAACGCTFCFRTKMVGMRTVMTPAGTYANAVITDRGEIPCGAVLLALGHSARDTYRMLWESGMLLQPKPFSVGVRIEHLQAAVNEAVYGAAAAHTAACGAVGNDILLPPAEYAVSRKDKPTPGNPDPRGVYSFCMCPGGEVMAAASEAGGVVVNGMSRHARDGKNANAALAVSVRKSDYGDDPMAAIAYQRALEQNAFSAGGSDYAAPAQTVGDFLTGKADSMPSSVFPTYMGGHVRMTDLHTVLPPFVSEMLALGIRCFDRSMPGFASPDAILTGVETRTSAPVRILRNETYQAAGCDNIYPVGEGAGYAGGITSAAVDGIRCACQIIGKYKS
ncbi:MAG: NAD(P)/FAD-dependent oxidoreductase, partial [Eubacteriales bacterium]